MNDQLSVSPTRNLILPKNKDCRWLVTPYSGEPFYITEAEKEAVTLALTQKQALVDLKRVIIPVNNIAQIIYRGEVEKDYAKYLDPLQQDESGTTEVV